MFGSGFMTGLGIGLCGGGAIIWLFKDTIQKWIMGAEAFANNLQTKVNAIKSALPKV